MATFYRTPWKNASGGDSQDYSSFAPRGRGPGRGASRGGPSSRGGSRGGYSARPSYGASRGGSRYGGGGGRGGRGNQGQYIDPSKFINKAQPLAEEAPFVPVHQFADFAIGDSLKANLAAKGYTQPTPIQDQAVPVALTGKDIVGLANTGTGKTGAFLIPLIDRAMRDGGLRVLVMAPTRELAVQIRDEFKGFAKGLPLSAALVVGGAGIYPQVSELKRNPAFVIGTPGRLKDMIERKALDLSEFSAVVLDEADRMLDMGFIDDMRTILGHMPRERHTLFFSATMSKDIEALIGEFLKDPTHVSVRTRETAASIDQDIVRVAPGGSKFEMLVDLLKDAQEFSKVLVFGRTKHGVERLAKDLSRRGIRAEAIHGNKTHNNRLKALDLFKKDHVQVLVATDVAARGLDISGVSHVINFDQPSTYEDYVHRIGRTGRAGKTGKALTFVN